MVHLIQATTTRPRRGTTPIRYSLLCAIGLGILVTVLATFLAFSKNHYFDQPIVSSSPPLFEFTLPQKNRTLLLVHIGKAGGLTLKETLKAWNKEPALELSLQQKSFHVWAYHEPHLEEASTLIVALRNPVDRIVSTFRYSHPENCTPEWERKGRRGFRAPFGCHVQHRRKTHHKMNLWAAKVYDDCFPSSAIEAFAQSTLSPWYDDQFKKTRECQKMARNMVEGSLAKQLAAPHMEYNYQYYGERTIGKYTPQQKEIIGIRMEHTEEDLRQVRQALARSVGVTAIAEFDFDNHTVSHGSETYLPSPVSTEAYHKLCCVLQKEIAIYQEFLQRAMNLSPRDRRDSMQVLKEKCGVQGKWIEWRSICQTRLERDKKELEEAMEAKK